MPNEKKPAEIPAPEPDAIARPTITLTLGGKRYEIAIQVTATELPEPLAKPGLLIEMPKPAVKS